MEQEKIEKIVTALSSKSLHISRVPLNTYNRFMEISNSADFCEDYGMCLKWLVDLHDGLMLTGMEAVMAEIEALKQEIIQLKSGLLAAKQENPKEKILRMISGRTIKIGTGGTDENGNTK